MQENKNEQTTGTKTIKKMILIRKSTISMRTYLLYLGTFYYFPKSLKN